MVTHPSANRGPSCLTWVILRELVFPTWYSRSYVAHRRDDLCGMLHTADAHRGNHFVFEYLGEIETEFENTLGCLSDVQMGSNHEKK